MNEELNIDQGTVTALRALIRDEIAKAKDVAADTLYENIVLAFENDRKVKRLIEGIVEDKLEDVDLSDAVESALDNMDLSDKLDVDSAVETAIDDKLAEKVVEIINGGSFSFST